MVKKLLAKWLEERRLSDRPPLPQDATIYIMAFVEWADNQAAQLLRSADFADCLACGISYPNTATRCTKCGGKLQSR